MAYVIKNTYNAYYYWLVEYSDPRTENFPMVKSPVPSILLIIGYLYFTCNYGPRIMKNRKEFNLKPIIIIYNLFQIIANATLLIYGFYWTYWQSDYNVMCTPITPHTDSSTRTKRVMFSVYLFFLLKMLDMLDTVFFVLKKQNGHISFLHVYHHAGMVVLSYISVKFLPGGHGTMLGVLNCFVHVCMYSYYLYSAYSTSNKKKVWWKKYITQLQLVQFVLLSVHFFQCSINPNCQYPKSICGIVAVQNICILSMFSDFYVRSYMREKPILKTETQVPKKLYDF